MKRVFGARGKAAHTFLAFGLLSGTAATATAADLLLRKPAPIEFVQTCPGVLAGFFKLPGTDTCMRIGGRLQYETQINRVFNRSGDKFGTRATGRVHVESRTETEYGPLRAVVQIEFTRQNGTLFSITQDRLGNATQATGEDFNGRAQMRIFPDRVFVQFGNLTAGRTRSFFDFYGNSISWIGIVGSDQGNTNLLAYTATLGSGFTATLSLEDGVERRQRVNDATGVPVIGTVSYGGSMLPEVVGNLAVEQSWGSAQLSAALHQLPFANTLPGSSIAPNNEFGYAAQAGVKINLPFLGKGDALWLQAAYADGALNYNLGGFRTQGANVQPLGGIRIPSVDAVVFNGGSPVGNIKRTQSYSFVGALQHFWLPTVRQGVFAGLMGVNYSATILNAPTGPYRDWKLWQVGTNLVWSPIPNMDIGAEVLYSAIDVKGRVADANRGGAFTIGYDHIWQARLRIRRDF
jgi:Porin subfamily